MIIIKQFNNLSGFWKAVLLLLVYLLVAIVMTWPLASNLATHTPAGSGDDVWAHHWNYWWVKTTLLEGSNPYYTDLLFFPEGVSLTTHNIPWFNIGLWIPLQAVLDSVTAFGLIYILVFAFNGLAMYLLAQELLGSYPAAFAAGLIFCTWPNSMSQYGHPNLIVVGWVPLALLMLNRTMDRGRVRDALLTGFFIALIGIVRWQLLIMASGLLLFFVIYKLLTQKEMRSRKVLILLVLSALVALLFMAPLLAPVIVDTLNRPDLGDVLTNQLRSSDLLSYFMPNRSLWLWDWFVDRLPDRLQFGNEEVEFIGYVTLILAAIGTIKSWRIARFWLLMALLYLVLALGPVLHLAGQPFAQIPLPYRIIQDFFLVQVLRFPMRLNVLLGLPVSILAALGVRYILHFPQFNRRSYALVTVLSILILAEYWLFPYRMLPVHTPVWYESLAQEAGQFGVLDLPMDPRGADKAYMLYQITHGKPLVQGHISRQPPESFNFLNSTPFLKNCTKKTRWTER